jgi:hypothetical protein
MRQNLIWVLPHTAKEHSAVTRFAWKALRSRRTELHGSAITQREPNLSVPCLQSEAHGLYHRSESEEPKWESSPLTSILCQLEELEERQ